MPTGVLKVFSLKACQDPSLCLPLVWSSGTPPSNLKMTFYKMAAEKVSKVSAKSTFSIKYNWISYPKLSPRHCGSSKTSSFETGGGRIREFLSTLVVCFRLPSALSVLLSVLMPLKQTHTIVHKAIFISIITGFVLKLRNICCSSLSFTQPRRISTQLVLFLNVVGYSLYGPSNRCPTLELRLQKQEAE